MFYLEVRNMSSITTALSSIETLLTTFATRKYDGDRNVCDHILQIHDGASELKSLRV